MSAPTPFAREETEAVEVPADEGSGEQAPPAPLPTPEDTGDAEVELGPPPDVLEVVADACANAAEAIADIARLCDHVADDRHRETLVRGFGQAARIVLHMGRLAELFRDAEDLHEEVPVEIADDPGDLTCPRCDGPITLVRLRSHGYCEVHDARASAVPPVEGDEPEGDWDADVPGIGEGEEE